MSYGLTLIVAVLLLLWNLQYATRQTNYSTYEGKKYNRLVDRNANQPKELEQEAKLCQLISDLRGRVRFALVLYVLAVILLGIGCLIKELGTMLIGTIFFYALHPVLYITKQGRDFVDWVMRSGDRSR